jgi:ABC-2 type transport system permease protein
MVICGVAIFAGIFILGAAFCFWTTDSIEVVNILSDGGRELASYPLEIYQKWLRQLFTFIIPFGCFNYLPLMYITDRAGGSSWLYMLTPLLGCLFIVPCLLLWRVGVRHYVSTGN